MKKIIIWTAGIFGSLIGILFLAVIGLYSLGSARLSKAEVIIRPVPGTADPAALARGEHIAKNVSVCISCHGANFEGKPFIEDPLIGFLAAPNLTSGIGGVGAFYTPEDWERAIRHGVAADGRVMGGMPSDFYAHLSDADVTALIAYLEQLPPVDNALPTRKISLPGMIIFGVLDYKNLPVAKINHSMIGEITPNPDVSVEYGNYLVDIAVCRDCHGPSLTGRSLQEAENGPPAGPDLTSAGSLQNWTDQEFITALRSGRTPEGRILDSEMPWPYYAGMSDEELRAIWLYLQTLPHR